VSLYIAGSSQNASGRSSLETFQYEIRYLTVSSLNHIHQVSIIIVHHK